MINLLTPVYYVFLPSKHTFVRNTARKIFLMMQCMQSYHSKRNINRKLIKITRSLLRLEYEVPAGEGASMATGEVSGGVGLVLAGAGDDLDWSQGGRELSTYLCLRS